MSLTQKQAQQLFQENKLKSIQSNRYKDIKTMKHIENQNNESLYCIQYNDYKKAQKIIDSNININNSENNIEETSNIEEISNEEENNQGL